MADLVQKVITFLGGTRREIIDHGVEGINWTIIKYMELGGGFVLSAKSTEDIPQYIGIYLVADVAVRYGNHYFQTFFGQPDTQHSLAPHPGIIGTIRQIRE